MRRFAWSVAAAFVMLGLIASHANAWGTKEHMMLTRLAVLRLLDDPTTPEDMKAWLRGALPGGTSMQAEEAYFMTARIGAYPRGAEGIAFWAVVPDLDATSGGQNKNVEPFGVPERLLHFIDLEFFHADESLRVYTDDLKGKPKIEDIPHDLKDPRYVRAGMLPFRIEQCYRSLVEQIREGRLNDQPGQFPRDEHATKWAGLLAHYVQDNTQPQHATVEYKSATYFADKRNAPNVHSEVEYRMPDDDLNDFQTLRADYWKEFAAQLANVKDPIAAQDVWQSSVELSLFSYDALPLIGQAAMKATGQGGTPAKPTGRAGKFDTEAFFRFSGTVNGEPETVLQMKAKQQALAVVRTAKLLRQAWDEAMAKGPTTQTTMPTTHDAE